MNKFEKLKEKVRKHVPESPIEFTFLTQLNTYGVYGICQFAIGNYFADMAFPEQRLVIECDGKEFHSTPEQIARDKQRDIFMQDLGWTVEHFSGSAIKNNSLELVHYVITKYFSHLQEKQGFLELQAELGRKKLPKRQPIDYERREFLKQEMWDVYEDEKETFIEEDIDAKPLVRVSDLLLGRIDKIARQ